MIRKLLLWWLDLTCPRFKEDIPLNDEPGPWVACALACAGSFVRIERKVRLVEGGLREAYIQARKMTLWLDWFGGYGSGYSIKWKIRRPLEGEFV